jgi:glycosyltransferase involved in cell wall biosynthesis
MRILLFNLATDVNDPVLGFTTRWIWVLAERVELIYVITMRIGHIDMPHNVQVRSVGKEKGYSEPHRVVEFYRHLLHVLRNDHIDVCFSHMIPIFTVLGAPVLKHQGIPIVTWFAHPSLSRVLKLAHHLSDRMVASLATAYPYKQDKLTAIGQGIDTQLFSPDSRVLPEDPPMILCVGRLSPVKDHPTLLKAIWLLRQRWHRLFKVVVLGGPVSPGDEVYVRSLHDQLDKLGLDNILHFQPPIPMTSLPSWYRRCTVHVNLTPTGSGDKVAWEAMSCGKPCLAANEGFRDSFGEYAHHLLFRYGDPEDLALRLEWALSLSDGERAYLGSYLRQHVMSMHSLQRLADRLVQVFLEVQAC